MKFKKTKKAEKKVEKKEIKDDILKNVSGGAKKGGFAVGGLASG